MAAHASEASSWAQVRRNDRAHQGPPIVAQGLPCMSAMSDEDDDLPPLPAGKKNYMTPEGHARLVAERRKLWNEERPEVVRVVEWAAGNGDRSENGDYIYGKRRLREIDRRLRFLDKRLEIAEVVDPDARRRTASGCFSAPPSPMRAKMTARSPSPSSASTRPTPGASAGSRRSRAPCWASMSAIPPRCPRPRARRPSRSWRSSIRTSY